MLFVDFDISSR